MSSHILHAYRLDGAGGGAILPEAEVPGCIADEELAWVHLDGNQPETREWISREASYLDPLVIDALLEQETRPRMARIDDGVLLILRGVNLNADSDPEDMVSIRLWIDASRIVSVRLRKLKAVGDIVERLEGGRGPRSAGEFVCQLVDKLFDRIQPVLTSLDEATDQIEEHLLETADQALREKIVAVRKQAIALRRYMAPQKDAIHQLRMAELTWLSAQDKLHLQEGFNSVTRYVEDLDSIRERAQIVKDELANVLADKLNRNMYVLSVVAAIFLPLGFLTGLFGINIGGMPGVSSDQAFMVFCVALVLVVALEVVVFRWFRWF